MNKNGKIQKSVYSKCLLHLIVLRVLCCSKCLFLYRPFCHGAQELDISTFFAAFFFEHLFSFYYINTQQGTNFNTTDKVFQINKCVSGHQLKQMG